MTEYQQRRQQLIAQLDTASITIIASANISYRNNDTEWLFRQDSDFYYLTGFLEANSLLLLIKDATDVSKFILFCQQKTVEQEIWHGSILGPQGAISKLGADEAYNNTEANSLIPKLLFNIKTIYYHLGRSQALDNNIINWLNIARNTARTKTRSTTTTIKYLPDNIKDISTIIHEMRLLKSKLEIDKLKTAANISATGHLELMRNCQAGLMEYHLDAMFLAHCKKHGCQAMAYSPIVASGNNACTLHYVANNSKLQAGDLILIDAGGEYQYYASDITRTFPVTGRFSEPQRAIYQLVLDAQLAAIQQVKPGVTFNKLQETILHILVTGLVKLKLLTGKVTDLINTQAYKKFYMHNSGHWLGLDVHDVGDYKTLGNWRTLQPGMVLTIEPGLYIAANASDVAAKWRGIGVRIEDDVLVTQQGHEVLSHLAPKTIDEIEHVMSHAV